MKNLQEQRIRHILSKSPAIIYAGKVDDPFNLTFVSENFSTRFGFAITELLNNPDFWRQHIHPDDCDCVFADYVTLSESEHHKHEYRLRKKNGEYLWVLDELYLVRDPEGAPLEIVGSWLDITDRKEIELELQNSEALFRDFFRTNPVATIITSPEGVVHMVNPSFTEHTDFTADEVVGRTAQELGFWRHPEDRERMVAAVRDFGFIDNLESHFFGKGGRQMNCIVSSRAVSFGGETRILSVVHDVTEQRKAEAELLKLDQAKSDFISTAAHELRTPLVAIVGYTEILENANKMSLSEEQRGNYLSIVQSNAEVLSRLVDDLLDVGRIQIGRSLGVVLKEASLHEIIENVVNAIGLKNKRHNIIVENKNPLPASILIDSGRITQVFYNLLSNAIKSSPHGGTIKIQTTTCPNEVSVSIVDQGKGMTPEQVEHIFDRFYQAESGDSAARGLGLGMSIVKQIIHDHRGEIIVTSRFGEGSTIKFTLPVQKS